MKYLKKFITFFLIIYLTSCGFKLREEPPKINKITVLIQTAPQHFINYVMHDKRLNLADKCPNKRCLLIEKVIEKSALNTLTFSNYFRTINLSVETQYNFINFKSQPIAADQTLIVSKIIQNNVNTLLADEINTSKEYEKLFSELFDKLIAKYHLEMHLHSNR